MQNNRIVSLRVEKVAAEQRIVTLRVEKVAAEQRIVTLRVEKVALLLSSPFCAQVALFPSLTCLLFHRGE